MFLQFIITQSLIVHRLKKTDINDRRGSAALIKRHPSIDKKLTLNFVDKWRSLSRYSSLVN
jgi:hypothetical protein